MVHLLFEQTNTFRDIFRKKGMPAMSYDIDGTPDVKIDLFKEIQRYFECKTNIFDTICQNDIVIAFFPCTYFSPNAELISRSENPNKLTNDIDKLYFTMFHADERLKYYINFCRLAIIAKKKHFKMIVENPYHSNYLNRYFPRVYDDKIVIMNRNEHGDYFRKPTMFFYFNCTVPFRMLNKNYCYKVKNVQNSVKGLERSKMSHEFAEFFIENFIN